MPAQFPPPYVTALVVDDERISRHVASRMLRELGLRVLEADGAEEALDVFRISQQPIDLVLLDVVMPETDGVELAEQLLAHRPGQRIIFMSAHPAEVLAEHGLQDLDVLFLAKPYTMDELLSKVRQAMDRRCRGTSRRHLKAPTRRCTARVSRWRGRGID